MLEDGAQREPGMIHQEELSLVVPEVLTESEGLLDHLLGAAHRQRCLLGEFLQ
jgi:hypothetical protein